MSITGILGANRMPGPGEQDLVFIDWVVTVRD